MKFPWDAKPADVRDRGGAAGASGMNLSWLVPAAQRHARKRKMGRTQPRAAFPPRGQTQARFVNCQPVAGSRFEGFTKS